MTSKSNLFTLSAPDGAFCGFSAEECAAAAISALEAGKETVVISGRETYDSAIIWLSADLQTRFAFSREIGECVLPYDKERLSAHFAEILEGGGHVIVRGSAFCDR